MRIVVFCLLVKLVNKLVNFIILIFGKLVVIFFIIFMCFFNVNSGFLFGLEVIVIIIWENNWDVCLIRLVWLLVIGLKVLG